MKAIWLACCACGDYGLLQREVEGRDAGAQVLRVGDLDGLVSMARAFPSRRGAAIIAATLFDAEDVRKTVARLTAEGRVSRVVVLIETLDPSDIEGLFRAGATEVIAARSICGNGRAGEGTVDYDRCMKPSMVGVPGIPLHTMKSESRCRMARIFWMLIWDTCMA